MYAKIFRQMYDGTLATNGPWQALVAFQQLLVLANDAGEVDMTVSAIARVTTIPREILEIGIAKLMEPDPESRTPSEDGRRLVPLSEHRSWGWRIVNYLKYRAIQKEEERREYHRNYYHEKRKTKGFQTSQQFSTASTDSTDTEADAEAEAEAEEKEGSTSFDFAKESSAKPHPSVSVPAQEPPRKAPRRPHAAIKQSVPIDTLTKAGFDAETAAEFIATKAARKAPLTPRAWADHLRESEKAGWTPQQAAEKVMAKTWKGFEAKYVAGEQHPPNACRSGFSASRLAETQRLLGHKQGVIDV